MPEHACPGAILHYDQDGDGPDIVWLSGGDNTGAIWHEDQLPFFRDSFRSTTYDARGVGGTRSLEPPPWSPEVYAADLASLIEAVCDPPVVLVGLSMGSMIGQQLSLDRPDLVRCAILLGTAGRSTGFLDEWMRAEIEFRRGGGQLTPAFATTHYGAFCYPPEVLGDAELWARLRRRVAGDYAERDGEALAAQWQACVDFNSIPRLPACRVPIHVIAGTHDLQTPPAHGRLVADTAANGHFHLFEGLAHLSIYGHAHDVLNPFIRDLARRYTG
ncbi:MAG: hypothetical protein AVDCRST_MAG79-2589 [uncultured Thermoleophilia bacterium]|uniref:AB hydrolase-1 domain-containing protein n=1 Tax=uncultured Thermoleophilia bacterium TaxID=1497501 RepID=A0A6J4UFS1_9ACTN|nr:MAG: hypothetical protein AVDCRST_MAG79-2589 [uncultured Thermoleophilia bacterium]